MTATIRKSQPVKRGLISFIMLALILSMFQWGAPKAGASLPASQKIIVGYWHNFDNGSGNIRLRDVSPDFDVINVSFAEPTNGAQGGTIGFAPYNATDAEFISDIQYLQSQGKKVLISIGGANGQVQLVNATARNNFVSSMKSIISKYGFNGLDIDFEGHSFYLNSGDSDFRNPTTPVITNVISAVRELHDFYGPNFMLTMAPETFFVQLGYTYYGGSCSGCDNRAGSYLPVIYGLRDILDWLQVQDYNSGSIPGLDGVYYSQGNADFHVAMTDMVLTGFPVAGNKNLMFPALRPDQVVIGLPANVNAGGGFTPVSEVQKALDYLMKGISFGGTYKLRGQSYPGMRGLMTWSINWDKYNNFEFSRNHRAYLNQFGGGGDTTPPSVPGNLRSTGTTTSSVSLAWDASTDNVGVTGYNVYNGATLVQTVSGTSATVGGLAGGTTYTFTVKARDAAGNVSASSNSASVKTQDNPTTPSAYAIPGKIEAESFSAMSGIQTETTTDTGGGLNVGWIDTGDWMDYSVNVQSAGSYTVEYRVASPNATGQIQLRSGATTLTTTTVPNTGGWQNWQTVTATVNLSAGQQTLRVYAGGGGFNVNWINFVLGGGDTQPPSAPTNLASTGKTSSSVNLAWSASTDNVGVTGYTVTYGTTSVNVTGTSTTISGLTANASYTFTVKARDAAGNFSAASAPLTVTTTGTTADTTPPSAPTNLTVTGKTSSSVSMSWTASTDNMGVTGYTVTYGSTSTTVTGTSATISGLAASAAYTFTVTARDAAGNVSVGSSVQATTDPGSGVNAWAANVAYKVGDLVTYGGKTYSCVQAHTSQLGWEPPNVPALWALK
jgi:chitinase